MVKKIAKTAAAILLCVIVLVNSTGCGYSPLSENKNDNQDMPAVVNQEGED